MREGAKDQVDGEAGTGPRKKWMKKGRLRAALVVFLIIVRKRLDSFNHFYRWWW